MADLGIVVIGRNEGNRLTRCLRSVTGLGITVVYVDSGSSDESVELAKGLAVRVVELDPSLGFGPARARNEGVRRLLELEPAAEFVQFLDGDCALCEGWIEAALGYLQQGATTAVVAGRLRERFPNASIYNQLCQIEWDGPVGEVSTCGGIAMVRVKAFQEIGGFDPSVLAGEESEMCLRLRRRGWRIVRLPTEVAIHDAAMTRLGQWWKRAFRSGYAYAQGATMHGRSPEHHFVREMLRALFWGFLLPGVALGAAWPSRGASLLLLGLYPIQLARIYRSTRRRGVAPVPAAAYALSCVGSKFAEIGGACKFKVRELRGKPMQLIEHR